MKNLCSLFLSLSIFLVLVCVGCDTGMQQNEKTDLVFSFKTPNFRSTQSIEDNPTLLIEACLVDYDGKTIQKTEKEISSGEAVFFQFLKIATNINIKVKIQVFVKGDESPSYTGESDWILTQAGANKVSIMLEKVLLRVNFNSMGGSEVPSQVLESGVVEKPENPTKEGYIFDDWYTSSNNGETLESVFDFDTPIEKDLTLYAKWTPISYTVKFDANNDNATGTMDDQIFTYDKAANLNKNAFEVKNYGFVGWNTKSDGTGTAYLDEAEILNLTTENGAEITLYAQWEIIETSIKVTFPSYNDPEKLITYDEKSQTFTAKEGYSSYEWFIDGDLQDENSNKFTLITTNMSSGGIYTVMLIVTTESGDMYSAEWQVTITK
ncbi:MAG: InlB B-repeat-containing protein [Spirochaetaceae bacterium]|nr:InlB B-repeat-containing protein [Spirochaetaceae bacterium]